MLLLQNLIFEMSGDDSLYRDFEHVQEKDQEEFHSGQEYQSWKLVPAQLLKLTWLTFAKYGRVNERALDKIWGILKESVIKVILNSDIKEGQAAPNFFYKDEYSEITEEEWERWFKYVSDRSGSRMVRNFGEVEGNARYSDRSRSLFKLLEKAYKAETPEEKLLAMDQIFNFVHGLGDMAKWFVEGGWQSLEDLSNAPVKGINLQGKLTESSGVAGKTFIVVDIQPEYEKSIWFLPKLVNYINQNYEAMGRVVFLYNGAETLGMIDESSYKIWWIENGLDETIVDQSDFYDKGYAFFRYCMDASSMSEETIGNFVRFMYENNIRDSREMTRDMWAKYLREYRRTDRKEAFNLLHHAQDCVNVPDLMDYLKRFNNLLLCGGGVNECLKEVEIALLALRKPYDVDSQFTY